MKERGRERGREGGRKGGMEEGRKERNEMKWRKEGERGREGGTRGEETGEIPWPGPLLNTAVSGHDNCSAVAKFQLGKEQPEDKLNAKEVSEDKGKSWGL